jgi:hypothetical protein
MGNPARGMGTTKASVTEQGGVVDALITLGATVLVVDGKRAIGKLHKHSVAKQFDAGSATDESHRLTGHVRRSLVCRAPLPVEALARPSSARRRDRA